MSSMRVVSASLRVLCVPLMGMIVSAVAVGAGDDPALAQASTQSGLMVSASCGDGATDPYDPGMPRAWSAAVTNPWFPLLPGSVREYVGETEEGTETIRVEVLAQARTVNGVAATVVHDEVLLEGELIEDTYDWLRRTRLGTSGTLVRSRWKSRTDGSRARRARGSGEGTGRFRGS